MWLIVNILLKQICASSDHEQVTMSLAVSEEHMLISYGSQSTKQSVYLFSCMHLELAPHGDIC